MNVSYLGFIDSFWKRGKHFNWILFRYIHRLNDMSVYSFPTNEWNFIFLICMKTLKQNTRFLFENVNELSLPPKCTPSSLLLMHIIWCCNTSFKKNQVSSFKKLTKVESNFALFGACSNGFERKSKNKPSLKRIKMWRIEIRIDPIVFSLLNSTFYF